ncbi:hypothetical protein [Streptomyces sp. G45]|uniref:hypothetical protein n=1 Tax=Streptomyces sp. G45 TaxID=3406627 RepID=UPI003C1F355E
MTNQHLFSMPQQTTTDAQRLRTRREVRRRAPHQGKRLEVIPKEDNPPDCAHPAWDGEMLPAADAVASGD